MPFVIDDLAILASIGAASGAAGAGAAGAGAAGAGGLAAAGAGAAGAAGASGAGGLAMAPGLASAAGGTMAPSLGAMPALGSSMPGSGIMGSAQMATAAKAPMNFNSVASKFAAPGTPGSQGGTPALAPAGSMMKSGGASTFDLKDALGLAGRGVAAGHSGMVAPSLMRSPIGNFQPFQFDRNSYRFRRPLGF